MSVIDDGRLAGGERFLEQAPLPRVASARIRRQIFADMPMRGSEVAAIKARLPPGRQTHQHDAFVHAFIVVEASRSHHLWNAHGIHQRSRPGAGRNQAGGTGDAAEEDQ